MSNEGALGGLCGVHAICFVVKFDYRIENEVHPSASRESELWSSFSYDLGGDTGRWQGP
jgi:hypothetical protein